MVPQLLILLQRWEKGKGGVCMLPVWRAPTAWLLRRLGRGFPSLLSPSADVHGKKQLHYTPANCLCGPQADTCPPVRNQKEEKAGHHLSWIFLLYFFATSVQRKAVGIVHAPGGSSSTWRDGCVGGGAGGHRGAASRLHSESRAKTSIRLEQCSQHAFS